MVEKASDHTQDIEIRGELDPVQRHVCAQLVQALQELDDVEIKAIGITSNMVVEGGTESPCVWFTAPEESGDHRLSAAIDTFRRKKVGVVSDYSFHRYRDMLPAVPFGATLGKYVLPDLEIDL